MWDKIFDWIKDHYPLLGLLIVVVVGVWMVASKYYDWKHRFEKTESDCNYIGTNINTLATSINTLTGYFNSLIVYLKHRDGTMDTSLFTSKSPLQLSELGERVLKVIGGKLFIDNNLEELLKEMDFFNIRTALDSQNFAPIVISKIAIKDSFKGIKDFVYKNPYYNEKNNEGEEISVPLDITTVTNIMGIYLRDKYLQKHPSLNPEEVAA